MFILVIIILISNDESLFNEYYNSKIYYFH